jgi:RNA polymerase sigma factor (sigma-70 family)
VAAEPSRGRATEVERSSAPEADAARGLYERHAGQLYGFCLHKLGSREEAEDAVQTTFLNAFRGLRRGVVPEAEAAWLFKIAENVCLTRRRSAWRRGRVESPSDMQVLQDVTPARQADGGDELIPLSEALAAMPDSQRRAILLREWQGLSYKEISDEMHVSQSAVETLIFRARRSLANALETPWESRRAAGQAGQRAFNLGSLLAGLKGLFAGGTAAKVAVVAVAAGGTAALAVADARHERTPPRVEPSAAATRAPDSAARRPVVVSGSRPVEERSVERGAASASKPASRRARSGRKAATGSRALAPGATDEAADAESFETSNTRETPPGQLKEPGTPATSRGRGTRPAQAAKAKPKSKPKQKPKPKSSAPKQTPTPAPEAEPAPKPEGETPAQPSGGFAPAPPAPPPPPPSPPAEKDKDKPKSG